MSTNYEYIINNAVLGERLRMCPTHKIVNQERIDPNHTKVVFSDLTLWEKQHCDKTLVRKGKPVTEGE